MKALTLLFAAVALLVVASAVPSKFPATSYGYVPINGTWGSEMFYALMGDKSISSAERAKLPLVIYLQGGPGASSLFGAFLENGPIKLEANGPTNWTLVDRVHAWSKFANMLYIDNPIGTGFSYTKDNRGYSTTDDGIADNLVIFMKGFLAVHPEYQTSPTWVFCESYGGKMTAYFGAALLRAVNNKELVSNFKGVALGDGWVDPVGCMESYGPYLQAFSQLTEEQVKNVTKYAQYAKDSLEEGRGADATNWWGEQQDYISLFTGNVNWYNDLYYYDYTADNQFQTYGETAFAQSLGNLIPTGVTFGGQSNNVFSMMSGSFMRDGISQVMEMIHGGLQVNVYGGQVDLIVDTLCIQGWIKKLNWEHLDDFTKAERVGFAEPGKLNIAGFVQRYKNFAFWQINQAGHMVPLDQPWAAEFMFTNIIGANSSNVPPSVKSAAPNGKKGSIHMRKHPKRV